MRESLLLHQGPGLNEAYLTADPLLWQYDKSSNTATCTLENYTLYIRGCPEPCCFPLRPETYKLLDLLVCELGDGSCTKSRQVELPLEEFLRLAGYTVTEANKDAVRPRLKESAALLGAMSADWTEANGQYIHHDVRYFDGITYQHGRVYACFSEAMALYLRGCPSLSLPLPLLAVSGKSPHSYLLGRRCLVHNAANRGQQRQAIRVRSLLDACPRIPMPASQENWQPSILKRKVIAPFTAAMNTLVECGILTWSFREPVCRDDYKGFVDSMVEFQVTGGSTTPTQAVVPTARRTLDPFDFDSFLAIR